jgi:hypothetical protein
MQSRAQRKQYGEPVRRLSLSVRYGQRHTRGLESRLVSIACSGLHVRSPRVHVPPPIFSVLPRSPRKRNGTPIPGLQSDLVLAVARNQAAEAQWRWAATGG